MCYSIDEHRHRFATWAAGRAATVKGNRFRVEIGKAVIETIELNKIGYSIDNLPSPEEFDGMHRRWREQIIEAASRHINSKGEPYAFTHGVAAKLINIYLKLIFVCGRDYEHPKVKAIHPPVDGLILDSLADLDVGGESLIWNKAGRVRWSNFNSEIYEEVIGAIQRVVGHEGLWTIEKHWRGFQ